MSLVVSLAQLLLRNALPYPDPLRRRRVRSAARELITCTPWPGDDATPEDIAQLALLRLLWLQSQTHRAARARQTEATCLLTRSAVETCLTGLYWRYGEDQVARMRGNNARSFHRLISYIADGDPITPGLVEDVAAAFGTPATLPSMRDMAEVVSAKTGEPFATDVYHRLYVPLSTLFPHATGFALLRHVRSNNQLDNEPTRVWSIRSATHTTDACVARLAHALAERTERSETQFAGYANAHMSRTVTPVAAMTTRAMIRSVRWSKLPVAYRSVMALRRYYDGPQAARDAYPERKARTKCTFDAALQVLDIDVPQEQRDLIIDHLADSLARQQDERGG